MSIKNQISKNLYSYIFYVSVIGFLFLGSCGDKNDPYKIADDVIPVETLPNEGSDKPINSTLSCNVKTTCLITTSQIGYGNLNITNDEKGNMYLEFKLDTGYFFKDLYLVVGNQYKEIPRYNSGSAAVTEYPYQHHFTNTGISSYTFKIDVGNENKCYVVSANAIIEDQNANELSIWAGCSAQAENTDAFYINKNIENGLYIGYCYKGCESIDFTYAWEDLTDDDPTYVNDLDYNDLVIQAQINESYRNGNEVESISMVYWAKARGASYNSKFMLDIPINGKSDVSVKTFSAFGEPLSTYQETYDGKVTITVYPDTKYALPVNGYGTTSTSNTDTTKDADGFPPCLVTSMKVVVNIDINDPSKNIKDVNLVQPYDPYIIVDDGVTEPYPLHIYSITGTDVFHLNGKEYPNGIIVPNDWGWPLEHNRIYTIYPDFPDTLWYEKFADNPQGYFDVILFGPPCEPE